MDINKLINMIASQKKVAAKADTPSRVYQDEPILITARQMKTFTPPKIREMRMLAKKEYYASAAKLFYIQGKFMEDFEDDFDYCGTFTMYFPTYQGMTDLQLRGYFSWRSKIRHGIIEKTSLSFVYVYLYELINLIGVSSPMEGFLALNNFWLSYRQEEPQIDRYLKLWLKDFVVYYNLDKELLKDFADLNFDEVVLTLLHYDTCSADEVFQALNSRSNYHLENSKFFKAHPEDVKAVVYNVYASLAGYYEKNRKNSILEKFFGKMTKSTYTMFSSAIFCPPVRHLDTVYEINGIYRYRCENGKWSCERFFWYGSKNKQLGTLLKSIDFHMRIQYGFKSTLKDVQTTKLFLDTINQEIEKLRQEKKKLERPKIEIDLSKLRDIRETALETQNKLIVEEVAAAEAAPDLEPETATPELSAAETRDDTELNASLDDTEYQLLRCLLYDKPYEGLFKSGGLMLSVLIDSVNEKLFDLFSDTVIDYGGDRPVLIEDYTEELRGIIKE